MAGGPEVQTIDGEWIYADFKPGNAIAYFFYWIIYINITLLCIIWKYLSQ